VNGPLLIIAGAGSGKTRVVTHRVAHMLSEGIPPEQTLSLTFTNKAAREMGERIASLVGGVAKITVSTFHSFGAMIVREQCSRLGLRPNFSIYDTADRRALIREVAGSLGWSADDLDPAALEVMISAVKTRRREADHLDRRYRSLHEEYHRHLRSYNAVDFDDLIALPVELFEHEREVLDAYRRRFRYITVDEFQDTSALQYVLLRLLALEHRNVCVVGDDDQSIYSWRGASYENILSFERDFPERSEVTLDRNYRSTGLILKAANALIIKNGNRRPKELWTSSDGGGAVRLFHAENEQAEAQFVAGQIKRIRHETQGSYADFGVLVRANSLTRPLEEELRHAGIPYQVSGGISFYQRREVKDILAYLRLMVNPEDEISLMRAMGTPRRGIGPRTVQSLVEIAEAQSCSLYSAMAAASAASDNPLPQRQAESVQAMVRLVEEYSALFDRGRDMSAALMDLVEQIGYWGHLVSETKRPEIARWRMDNVESLAAGLARYEKNPDNLSPSLRDYLNRVSLLASEEQSDEQADHKVSLMTIHAAKGLEFPTVFVAAVEQDILPHSRSVEDGDRSVEEERRLFYVAITRARSRLFLTRSASRIRRGRPVDCLPSPFLEEIPTDLLESVAEEDFLSPAEAAMQLEALRARLSPTGKN
jgi:DNA helicase-2/ATP-dependent DNA helicase PcrA